MGAMGHSDADIVCHAATDAILGAACLGDIGRHFPDTAFEWKAASTLDLLRRAVGLGYFSMIGLAFITVEIALLQKLSLFLGHPAYALVVVLFSILLATAAGARLSSRIRETTTRSTLIVGLIIAAIATIAIAGLTLVMVVLGYLVQAPGFRRIERPARPPQAS